MNALEVKKICNDHYKENQNEEEMKISMSKKSAVLLKTFFPTVCKI